MDDQSHERRNSFFGLTILATAALAAAIAVLMHRWHKRWVQRLRQEEPPPLPPVIPPTIHGLTEAEAKARSLKGQDNTVHFHPPRSLRKIWQDNVFTLYNLSLVSVAVVQFLLGRPVDAVLSLGVFALNVGLNIGQELVARRLLLDVVRSAQPQATVIRETMVRSIDPSEVVRGDVLVVGPGDQFLVDGEIVSEGPVVVDQSMLTDGDGRLTKRTRDPVYAGSFCVSGRAVYEAQRVGDERLIVNLAGSLPIAKETLTPLEQIIDRILRVLLLFAAGSTVLLLLRFFEMGPAVNVTAFMSAAIVIFSAAPASLFFMIFLTYVIGTAVLVREGALVHRARSVEGLAQATVVCFASRILTGTHVEMEPVKIPRDQEHLAESRIRQILGDYARSSSDGNPAIRAMVDAFEGERRIIHEEAPFLSVYGWSAIAFDDDDLRGIYVLGKPEILAVHLGDRSLKPTEGEGDESLLTVWRERLSSFGRIFRRSPGTQEESADVPPQSVEPHPSQELQEATGPDAAESPKQGTSSGEDTPGPNIFLHSVSWISKALRRGKTEPEEAVEEVTAEDAIFLFAYHPRLVPLHGDGGPHQLPDDLIPLCRLRYAELMRPGIIDTIQTYSRTGASIKVFSSSPPDRTMVFLRQAGLDDDGDGKVLPAISGSELADLGSEQLVCAASENAVFGHITPEQARLVVAALREQGQSVVVVGDGVNDLLAMRQADVSIARQSSSQAALSVADIVLLKDSPRVLPTILEQGQRIVNGLLDVLKLYLTQAFYLLLLIIASQVMAAGFPYQSKQGTLIVVVTLLLPSLGLTLWAAPSVLPSTSLGWLLARSVGPTAVTISAAGLMLYWFFLDRTGEVAYAQLALTHMLVVSGLVLVILVRPPMRPRVGGDIRNGDWRPTALALALLILVFVVASLPLGKELFLLTHLRQPTDYVVVGLAVLAWVFTVRFIWWIVPPSRQEPLGRKRIPVAKSLD